MYGNICGQRCFATKTPPSFTVDFVLQTMSDQYIAADLNHDGRTTRSESRAFRSGKLPNKAAEVVIFLDCVNYFGAAV